MFILIHLNRRRLVAWAVALIAVMLLGSRVVRVASRLVMADVDVAIRYVPVNAKVIALTFDDGPDAKFTPPVLDVLRAYRAKATFFVVGTQIEYYPDVLRQVAAAGHEIGSHTYSHPRLGGISQDRLRKELERSADLIRETCGVTPVCFRPPYGSLNAAATQVLRDYGYSIILWDKELDSRDWERPGVDKIVGRIIKYARPGGIILMHDGGGYRSQTVTALPKILKQLGDQGYRFVTVSELLRLSEQAQGQPPQ